MNQSIFYTLYFLNFLRANETKPLEFYLDPEKINECFDIHILLLHNFRIFA